MTTPSSTRTKFTDWLSEHDAGTTDVQATEYLADLIHACRQTNKKGKLTIAVEVDPTVSEEAFAVTATVAVKVPEPPAAGRIYYTTFAGDSFTRRHPSQPPIDGWDDAASPPAPVSAPPGVDPETGETEPSEIWDSDSDAGF